MAIIETQVTPQDYARASSFVVTKLRQAGRTQTSLAPLSILSILFFTIPLFVIATAPNAHDAHTKLLIRGSVLALFIVPFLFVFGVWRLRKADARALRPLATPQSETVFAEATASGMKVAIAGMTFDLPWSQASVLVVDETFAVVLAPLLAPIPLTRAGASSSEGFYLFLRHAQQFKSASAA